VSLPEPLNSILAFVVVLGVLIFVHEWGHYAAARSVKVRVEVFSIGFGRSIWSRVGRDGTVWKLGWMPLGGYVKLHGQEPPDPDNDRAPPPGPDSFAAKPVWARAWIVAAGPLANFVLAAVLFALLFGMAGQRVPAPIVQDVVAGMPAAAAGLQAGDRVLAVDGSPISRFDQLQARVREADGRTLVFKVQRDGATLEIPATPARQGSAMVLGIRGGAVETVQVGPLAAVGQGVAETWRISVATLDALWGMATLQRSADDLGGPLGIARMSGEVATLGLAAFVTFMAVLSVNLGLLNLLPIPILDGGHLVLFAAEAVRGKPLPQRAVEYGFRVGLVLLLCIFVFATQQDLAKFGFFDWVSGLFG
jgi:regulator of sigma E protease